MLLAIGLLASTLMARPVPDHGAIKGEVAVEAVGTSDVAIYVDTNADASFDERFLLQSAALQRDAAPEAALEDADGHRVSRLQPREALPLPLHFSAAVVQFESGYVRVIAEDQALELFVDGARITPWNPLGIRVWRQGGYGLSHSVGESGIAITRPGRALDITADFCDASSACDPGDTDSGGSSSGGSGGTLCDAGGPGATECSVSRNGSSCTATCSTGYYACCMYGTPSKCRCIRAF
jgi:hypothetical protein